MSIHLKNNQEVNVGDHVIYFDKNHNVKRIGKYESLYGDKMNIRLLADNELLTIPFGELEKATPDIIANYYKNKTKEELLAEIKIFNKSLEKFGLIAEVREIKKV